MPPPVIRCAKKEGVAHVHKRCIDELPQGAIETRVGTTPVFIETDANFCATIGQ